MPIDWRDDMENAPKDRPILVGRGDIPIDDVSYYPAYAGEGFWDTLQGAFCFQSQSMSPGDLIPYASPTHWAEINYPPSPNTGEPE